jgi:Tle cognate immunity protein 4 C-terminal domain
MILEENMPFLFVLMRATGSVMPTVGAAATYKRMRTGFEGGGITGWIEKTFAAGIYLPSLPDVSFSVSSNTGANTVGLGAKGLLHSMQEQRGILGRLYPQFTSFREGKKTIGLWNGEEVLSRRKDGTHEFDWGAISAERSVAQPGRLRVKLYSKVEQNRIGAAAQASVSDAEAIALWDKLLGSLTYRVEVPGGPVQKATP